MITSKQTKLINDTFSAFQYAFENIDCTNYAKRLLALTTEESKCHDGYRADSIKRGMSISTEAKFFALKRYTVYRFMSHNAPTAEQWFHIQHSCYAAYAMAFDKKLQNSDSVMEFDKAHKENLLTIASLDYCELIK